MKDFNLGEILDKQRTVSLCYSAEFNSYQMIFTNNKVTDEQLVQRQQEAVTVGEDGTVITRVILRPDTMQMLIGLYMTKLLNDEGVAANTVKSVDFKIINYEVKEES